jgi:heme/copper-type cytochrome/quinol oxidase subunit 3
MHRFIGGWSLLSTGFCIVIFYVCILGGVILLEKLLLKIQHTITVQKGLRLGMILFIVSEIMFFFAFFGLFSFKYSSSYNIGGVWPPKAITTMEYLYSSFNKYFFLLTSGATVTWAHHALVARAKKHTLIALIFTLILAIFLQVYKGFEYVNAPFNISDGIYGSCFYMATGFHGFHVFVGTLLYLYLLLELF